VLLAELGDVRNACISATVSMELLCATVRAVSHGSESRFIEYICQNLVSAAGSTASGMGKLLQGIENNIESMVVEARVDITAATGDLCEAAGELAIATAREENDAETEADFADDFSEDPSEFAAEEEEVTYASSSRMVDINADDPRRSSSGPCDFRIADDILAAFERGTRTHVHNSMARLTNDMEDATITVMDLVGRLGPRSNVNATVVHAAANVMKSTRDAFEVAQELQEALSDTDSTARAKRTFYRKNFALAKGVINEVRDMADAISSIQTTVSKAVNGNDDVESLMSHAKNLRAAIARLIHASEFKLGRKSTAAHRMNVGLRNSCAEVTRASKQLTADCEEYSQSDAGRAKRQSRLGSPIIGSPLGSRNTSMRRRASTAKTPQSDVQRRTMLVEQQSEVYRLEAELRDAQTSVKKLQKSMYTAEDNESTSNI